jgi:hypothetical protein
LPRASCHLNLPSFLLRAIRVEYRSSLFPKFACMEFPRIPFHRKTHRRYNYQPIYYDPQKEDLDQRVKMAKGESDNYAENIRKGFRSYERAYGNRYNEELRKSKIRTYILVAAFSYLFYRIFTSEIILKVFEAFIDA